MTGHGTAVLIQYKAPQRNLWTGGHAMADLKQAIRVGL
jgi:hypothetical protein